MLCLAIYFIFLTHTNKKIGLAAYFHFMLAALRQLGQPLLLQTAASRPAWPRAAD